MILSWRRNLISDIESFYVTTIKEQDSPHLYAIAVVSVIDFFISFAFITMVSDYVRSFMIIYSIFLLIVNGLIYFKTSPVNKNFLFGNIFYFLVFVLSILLLYG